jgi:hypothetical protein
MSAKATVGLSVFGSPKSDRTNQHRSKANTPICRLGNGLRRRAGLTNSTWGADMEPKAISQTKKTELADDTLEGASAIAEFLFGSRDKTRKVYHLVQKSKIPIYRLGALLHARKSVLMEFIAAQERRVMLEDAEGAVPAEAALTPAAPISPGNTELNEVTESSKHPIFGLRSVLRERKSALLKFITGEENRVLPPDA